MTLPKFKVSLPSIIAILGGSSFVGRVLHVPDAKLASAVGRANVILAQQQLPAISPAQFRAVEQTQQEIVTNGIPDLSITI